MSTYDNLPPPPYGFITISAKGAPENTGHVYLTDANGRKIASLWGKPDEKIALANFICDKSEKLKKVEP